MFDLTFSVRTGAAAPALPAELRGMNEAQIADAVETMKLEHIRHKAASFAAANPMPPAVFTVED